MTAAGDADTPGTRCHGGNESAPISVELDGLDELLERLADLDEGAPALAAWQRPWAEAAVREAHRPAPVATGRLRWSGR